jgi:hypothetical protein
MSIKIDMMVKHVKENNKDYKLFTKSMIRCYLKDKFKCSAYMANKAAEKLLEE